MDHKGLSIENLNEFNKEHSPTIPKGFPKERLPKDLCQHTLNKLLMCLMGAQANTCGDRNKKFYICKRERDAQLFTLVKDWEIETFNDEGKFRKLIQNDELKGEEQVLDAKKKYIRELSESREELVKQFESTPSSIANKHKRWRMAADVEQLQWRVKYLNEQLNY